MKNDMESMLPFWADTDQVYGEIERKKETLINLIKDFDQRKVIIVLARLIDVINTKKTALNATYILPFLNRKEKKRLQQVMNTEEDVVLDKQQLYSAMKIVLKYAKGDEEINEKNKSNFGKFLLSINYLSDESARIKNENNSDQELNNLAAELLPVYTIATQRDPNNRFTTHSIGRQYFNYHFYWQERKEIQMFKTLKQDFKIITKQELKDYFTLCFALASIIVVNKEQTIDLNIIKYFSNTPKKENAKFLNERFCTNVSNYKNTSTWKAPDEDLISLLKPDYLPIYQYPLCQLEDENNIMLDKSLLAKKILEDPYWILLNHYQQIKDKSKERIPSSLFGFLWQEYVRIQIQENLTKNLQDLDKTPVNSKIADFLIETKEALIVIEAKHFIYKIETQAGNLASFKEDSLKIFGEEKGLIQIDNTIENLKLEEKDKKIYRVIITDELIYQSSVHIKYYEDQFDSWTPKNENISCPIIITKDEFERIITIGLDGFCQLLKIRDEELKDKGTNGFVKNVDIQTLMLTLQQNPQLKKLEKHNLYSDMLFKEVADYVRKCLFPKRYEKESEK